jgi:aspartyl aminopeptidase
MWRVALIFVLACAGRSPAPEAAEPAEAPAPGDAATRVDRDVDPLFPAREHGWKALDPAGRQQARVLADDYAGFLDAARTPRRAVAGLIDRFGAEELAPGARPAAEPGARYGFVAPGGDAAALIRVGTRPLADGLRILVAAVDAPRIDLKQSPVQAEGGLILLDTYLYGPLDLAAWLARPLALHLHAARPGASSGAIDLIIGDGPDEPVLVIPDLLPHLSRRVQAGAIVDRPERMDAIAARSLEGLVATLRQQGLDESVFADAEVSLVPASAPTFIGVDRALLAGYGHGHRALAYAAMRALVDGPAPAHTAVVIVVSKHQIGGTGATGVAFVEPALRRVIAALHPDAEPDVLDVSRVLARSQALVARRLEGERNRGVILDPSSDDALPAATRRVLDAVRGAGAQVQIVSEGGWGSDARILAGLDLDAVDIGLPLEGAGTPLEVLSVLDLHAGYLAAIGWLTGS